MTLCIKFIVIVGLEMPSVNIRSTNLENIVAGNLTAKWSARGDRVLRYYIDVRHTKMNLHEEVSTPELFILQSKIDALMDSWDEKYQTYLLRNRLFGGQSAAEEMTADALRRLDALGNILKQTLAVDDRINWDGLKDKTKYAAPKEFAEPRPVSLPIPSPFYEPPKISFFQSLFGKKASLLAEAEQTYLEAQAVWQNNETSRKEAHEETLRAWE